MTLKVSWKVTDQGRLDRAVKLKNFTVLTTGASESDWSAECIGSRGDVYHATLEHCDCPDAEHRGHQIKCCKHMIRLAIEARVIDRSGLSPEDAAVAEAEYLRMKAALAYGYEQLFHQSIIAPDEYARMMDTLHPAPATPVSDWRSASHLLQLSYEDYVKLQRAIASERK